jgi:hypothetical protein
MRGDPACTGRKPLATRSMRRFPVPPSESPSHWLGPRDLLGSIIRQRTNCTRQVRGARAITKPEISGHLVIFLASLVFIASLEPREAPHLSVSLGSLPPALPPRANRCILLKGASTAKGKTHVASDAGSVRGDYIVGSGRSIANRRFRTSIQSWEWWNHGGRKCRVCRSRRTAQQNVGSRPGWGTIQVEQSGAV